MLNYSAYGFIVSLTMIGIVKSMIMLINPKIHCVSGASCFCAVHEAQRPSMQAAEVATEEKQETLFTQPDF